MLEFLDDEIRKAGVYEYGFVDPADVDYLQEVRDMCETNRCRRYGTSWACPPAIGTVKECKERCLRYNTMMVFTVMYPLKRPFDYKSMKRGMQDFKQVARRVEALIRPYYPDCLMMSNESCDTCETCTYPDNPCRFPEKVHHSIEGYGIVVYGLTKKAGIKYDNGDLTITYVGAALFNI